MQEKRTRVPSHSGVTKFKRGGRIVGYRAQVIDPRTSKKVSANTIVNGARGEIFPHTKQGYRDACSLCWQAEDKLGSRTSGGAITVPQLRERFLARTHGRTGKLKESTQIVNAERTKRYADEHPLRIDAITDEQARDWAAGANSGERQTVKTMFAFAVEQGLLIASPFRFVAIEKGRGNEEVDPPTPAQVDRLVAAAQKILPSWGAWLCFGRWVGTRPGETDMLRFSDFEEDFRYVRIRRQWNVKAGKVTAPKHNRTHRIAVPPAARAAVKRQLALRTDSDVISMDVLDALVFPNTRGGHFTQTSRASYWKATTAAADVTHTDAGETVTPYLATRHFCGWYMTNVLRRDASDVAHQLRHGDGGTLVRQLYGHRNADLAAADNLAAFDEAA
jgi:integrase